MVFKLQYLIGLQCVISFYRNSIKNPNCCTTVSKRVSGGTVSDRAKLLRIECSCKKKGLIILFKIILQNVCGCFKGSEAGNGR